MFCTISITHICPWPVPMPFSILGALSSHHIAWLMMIGPFWFAKLVMLPKNCIKALDSWNTASDGLSVDKLVTCIYIYIDSWNSWNVKSPSPNARAWRTYALPGHEWLIVLLWHIFVETWLDSTPWWADFLEIKVAMGNLLPLLPRASQHYPRVFVQVQKK